MKITSKPLALVIVVVLFGGIFLTTALDWWKDGASKTPRKITEGEATGQYNPADIRGSYTFGDVSKYFNIPLDTLRIAFHVPADKDIAALPLKELETIDPSLSPHSVGLFAAFYNGLPFSLVDEPLLSGEAVAFLKQQGKMTPEQAAYVEAHIVNSSSTQGEQTSPTAIAPTSASIADEDVPTGKTITSSTTFKNLLDWGLSKETIEKVIGGTIPSSDTTVRSYFTDKGLEFKTYKDRLQEELNKIK
jgi:hypothetical protein